MIQILVLTKEEIDTVIRLNQSYYNQIQELQAQLDEMKAENDNLKMINRELQWRVDPYSLNGDAVGDSNW
ncbi:hypothetical protein [Argonema antarcticum]|uniref:hypothetical protein n=1 Tax=Argonema antarcticum TaxID=2942763 RepID=UPI002011F12E|nr:hypothetical protein [Argonema antarcticum]MCL1473325.1 hypothetical protein [Argonema antarcticum A004/B2]